MNDYCLRVVSNRAGRLWQEAAKSIKPALSEDTLISYWDTLGDNPLCLDKMHTFSNHIQLINRKWLNQLSNKRILPTLVSDHGLEQLIPRSFETACEAMEFAGKREIIWFVKRIHGTAGKGMYCVKTEDLLTLDLDKESVLQEGITDIALIEDKKFVTRVYLLCWNRKLFLFKRSFCVIHGVSYDRDSTEYDVQIDHSGYADPNSSIQLVSLAETDYFESIIEGSIDLFSRLKPVLLDVLGETSPIYYAILGADVILEIAGNLRLIEINSFPNFIHTDDINSKVNVPFLTSVLELVTGTRENRNELISL